MKEPRADNGISTVDLLLNMRLRFFPLFLRHALVQEIQVVNRKDHLDVPVVIGNDPAQLERGMPYLAIEEEGLEEFMVLLFDNRVPSVVETIRFGRRNVEFHPFPSLLVQKAVYLHPQVQTVMIQAGIWKTH